MRETSLEEFAGGGESADGDDSERTEATGGDGTDSGEESEKAGTETEGTATGGTGPGETSEATSTYAWTPDGVSCPACGASVERRWRDGDRLVCAECVSW